MVIRAMRGPESGPVKQRVRPYSGPEPGHSEDQSQAVERTSVIVQCETESGLSDNWIQGKDEGQALARRRVMP